MKSIQEEYIDRAAQEFAAEIDSDVLQHLLGWKYKVKVRQPWAEVLSWLQSNVGDLLHSKPIIFWHGVGWHLKAKMGECIVEFEHSEDAVMFALKWA